MPLRALIFLLLTAAASALAAEDTTPPDFSDGLGRLAKLGLPDMTGAVWERAPESLQRSNYLQDWQFRQLNANIRGGAWRLADGSFLAFATGTPTEIQADSETEEAQPSSPSLFQKMAQNFSKQNPSDAPAKPKPKPKPKPKLIEGDVNALIKTLESPKVREELQSSLRYRGAGVPGRCLIFAAQIHASGETELANQIAGAVFATVSDRSLVIDAAVSHFADSEFEQISSDFFANHDWQEYHEKLTALAAKFPRGWDRRLALALLLPKVEARLNQDKFPTPSLPGITLNDEALTLLEEWLAKPADSGNDGDNLAALAKAHGINLSEIPVQYRAQMLASLQQRHFGGDTGESGIWLLPKTNDSEQEDAPESTGPVARTKKLGMDGLIAIASVTSDETLTHLQNRSSDGSSYFLSSETPAERAMRAYSSMSRPMTRGEIATSLLAAVIPDPDSTDRDELDPQLLQESAIEFWKQNLNKSPIDLARIYLRDGSNSQRNFAATFLSNSDDPAAAPAFEKAVLESDDILQFTQVIPPYLQLRKSKALTFFTQYSKQLTEALDGIDEDRLSYSGGGWAIKEAGGAESYLKKIGVPVGASSIDDLIADALKSDKEDGSQNHYPQLLESIGSIPVEDLLAAFGKAMTSADSTTRIKLLQTLPYRSSRANEDEATYSENKPFPEELAKLWIPILDDETTIELDDSGSNWFSHYDCDKIGTAAALTLEFAIQEDSYSYLNHYKTVHFDDDTFPEFISKRSLARIKGEEMEAYPSGERISQERRDEIAAMAEAHAGADLRSKIIALDSNERSAWLEWRESLTEEEIEVPSSLLEMRTMITGRAKPSDKNHPNPDPELLKTFDIDTGSKLDAAKLEKITNTLLKQSGEHSGTIILFNNAPLWLGLEVVAYKPDLEPAGQNRFAFGYLSNIFRSDKAEGAEAIVLVSPISQRSLFLCLKMDDGEVTPIDFGMGDSNTFAERFDEVLAEKNPDPLALSIAVLTREDFNKQQQQE